MSHLLKAATAALFLSSPAAAATLTYTASQTPSFGAIGDLVGATLSFPAITIDPSNIVSASFSFEAELTGTATGLASVSGPDSFLANLTLDLSVFNSDIPGVAGAVGLEVMAGEFVDVGDPVPVLALSDSGSSTPVSLMAGAFDPLAPGYFVTIDGTLLGDVIYSNAGVRSEPSGDVRITGTITLETVPVPAAGGFLVAGVVAMGALRRTRSQAA